MRGDVKGTFAAWIAATNDFAVGSRPGSTRGRVLHFVQFFYFFLAACLPRVRVREEYYRKNRHFFRLGPFRGLLNAKGCGILPQLFFDNAALKPLKIEISIN